MVNLYEMRCVACRSGEPSLTETEINQYHPQVADWSIREVDGIKRLERVYQFGNFVQALAFTNKIGEIAEADGHHPLIVTEYGKVTVDWWTHKIKGLHKNDFIMAAKTDQLFQA